MLAVMGLLPWTAKITADRLAFQGEPLLQLSARQRRRLVGKDMAMIFQEPMSSLNPCFTVEFQLTEALRFHEGMDRKAARDARPGAARPGRHPVAAGPARRLPAPALRRHEPAGDDRHGDRLQPQAADRRRADDRTRRHHPGPDPRPAARPAARARHGADPDHPRHGRGRRDRRPGRGAVCRPAGRGAARVTGLFADAMHPYTAALLAALPERSRGAAAADHPGRGAGRARPADRAACSTRAARSRPTIAVASSRRSATARAAGSAATTR